MSYLGWLEITASRPGAARKAITCGAAGCSGRVRCAPCASSGAAGKGQGHRAGLFTVGSRAGQEGWEVAAFLGFWVKIEERAGVKRLSVLGPERKPWLGCGGGGPCKCAVGGPRAPFPGTPARRGRWRTLPRQSAAAAEAAIAMSLNLNGSSSLFPS